MIKISAVTMNSKYNDIDYNINQIEEYALIAKDADSSIVCFPELSISGYSIYNPKEVAQTLDCEAIARVSNIAVKNNITVLAGLIERENNHIYITHVVLFPDGKIEKYRKTHLGRHEKKHITEGNELNVFSIDIDGKRLSFGIALCYDNHFPEAITSMVLKGAHIVFCPHASLMDAKRRIKTWQKYMCARAYDNRIYVVAMNAFGYSNDKYFGGGLAIWSPYGDMVKYFDKECEQINHFDIDFEEIERIRIQNKSMRNQFFLKDRRAEIYR
ncbi:hypothetical protein PV797_19545 [Clostridiaceae bacterium M8S5]|nr:hypothetical protein PV797_19545 [Clostridiaceae bacterium M8S5]